MPLSSSPHVRSSESARGERESARERGGAPPRGSCATAEFELPQQLAPLRARRCTLPSLSRCLIPDGAGARPGPEPQHTRSAVAHGPAFSSRGRSVEQRQLNRYFLGRAEHRGQQRSHVVLARSERPQLQNWYEGGTKWLERAPLCEALARALAHAEGGKWKGFAERTRG